MDTPARPSREDVLRLVDEVGVKAAALRTGYPIGTVKSWAHRERNRNPQPAVRRASVRAKAENHAGRIESPSARARTGWTEPTFTDAATAATILDGLRKGLTRRLACGKAGVSEMTMQGWARKAAEGVPLYVAWERQVVAAEAQRAETWLDAVPTSKSASAMVELLGRRFKDDYGRAVVEHQVSVVHLGAELSRLPAGELAALLERASPPRQVVDVEVVEPDGREPLGE